MVTIKCWQLAATASIAVVSMAGIRLASADTQQRDDDRTRKLESKPSQDTVITSDPVIEHRQVKSKPSQDTVITSDSVIRHLDPPTAQVDNRPTIASIINRSAIRKIRASAMQHPDQSKKAPPVAKPPVDHDAKLREVIQAYFRLHPPKYEVLEPNKLQDAIETELKLHPPKFEVVGGTTTIELHPEISSEVLKAFQKTHK